MKIKRRRQLNRFAAFVMSMLMTFAMFVAPVLELGVMSGAKVISNDTGLTSGSWTGIGTLFNGNNVWYDAGFWSVSQSGTAIKSNSTYTNADNCEGSAGYVWSSHTVTINNASISCDLSGARFNSNHIPNGFYAEALYAFTPVSSFDSSSFNNIISGLYPQAPSTSGIWLYCVQQNGVFCIYIFVDGTKITYNFAGTTYDQVSVAGNMTSYGGNGIVTLSVNLESVNTSTGIGTYSFSINGVKQVPRFTYDSRVTMHPFVGVYGPYKQYGHNGGMNVSSGQGRTVLVNTVNGTAAANITTHNHSYQTTVAPTTSSTGYETCSVCGAVNPLPIVTCTHPSWVTTSTAYLKQAATCTSAAQYWKTCSVCGMSAQGIDNTQYFTSGGLASHTWTKKDTTSSGRLYQAATCTTAAVYYYSCNVCGANEQNASHTFTSGSALGHTVTGSTAWGNSGSGSTAHQAQVCTRCNQEINRRAVISYDSKGGSSVSTTYSNSTTGTSYSGSVSSTVPSKNGFSFSGWATTDGGAVVYSAGDSYHNLSGNITLYAVWSRGLCTKTVDLTNWTAYLYNASGDSSSLTATENENNNGRIYLKTPSSSISSAKVMAVSDADVPMDGLQVNFSVAPFVVNNQFSTKSSVEFGIVNTSLQGLPNGNNAQGFPSISSLATGSDDVVFSLVNRTDLVGGGVNQRLSYLYIYKGGTLIDSYNFGNDGYYIRTGDNSDAYIRIVESTSSPGTFTVTIHAMAEGGGAYSAKDITHTFTNASLSGLTGKLVVASNAKEGSSDRPDIQINSVRIIDTPNNSYSTVTAPNYTGYSVITYSQDTATWPAGTALPRVSERKANGTAATLPAPSQSPVVVGDFRYTWDGWYDGSTKVTSHTVSANKTFTGKWTVVEVEYNVNVSVNNSSYGSASANPVSSVKNQTITLNATANTGYHFTQWSNITPSSLVLGSTTSASTTFTMPSGNVSVKANFAPNTYTVVFYANGGTGSMQSQSFSYGTAQNLTSNSFTRTNWFFSGWNTQADGSGTSYADGQSVSNLTSVNGGTVTLYAQWMDGYVITFNAGVGHFDQGPNDKTRTIKVSPGNAVPLPSASGGMSEIPAYSLDGEEWGFVFWTTDVNHPDDTSKYVFGYNNNTGAWTLQHQLVPTGSVTLYPVFCGHGAWHTSYNNGPSNVSWTVVNGSGVQYDASYCPGCQREMARRFAVSFRSRTRTLPVASKHEFFSFHVYVGAGQTSATIPQSIMCFAPCEIDSVSLSRFRGWTNGEDHGNAVVYNRYNLPTINSNTSFIASYSSTGDSNDYLEYVLVSLRIDTNMGTTPVSGNYTSAANEINANASMTWISQPSYSQVLVKKKTETFRSIYTAKSTEPYFNFPYYTTWFKNTPQSGAEHLTFPSWKTTFNGGEYFIEDRKPNATVSDINIDSLWSGYNGYALYLRYYAYNRYSMPAFSMAEFSAPYNNDNSGTYGVLSDDHHYVEVLIKDYDKYYFPVISKAPDGSNYPNDPVMGSSFTERVNSVDYTFYRGFSGSVSPKFRVSHMVVNRDQDHYDNRIMQLVSNNLRDKYRTPVGAFWQNDIYSQHEGMTIEPMRSDHGHDGNEHFQDAGKPAASIFLVEEGDEEYYGIYQPWDFGVKFSPGSVTGKTIGTRDNSALTDIYTFIRVVRDSENFLLLPNDYWVLQDYYIDAWFVDINQNGILDDFEKEPHAYDVDGNGVISASEQSVMSYFPLKGSNILRPDNERISVFQYLFSGYECAVKYGNDNNISNRILTTKATNGQVLTLTAHWERSNVTIRLEGNGYNSTNNSSGSYFTYIDDRGAQQTAYFPNVAGQTECVRSVYAEPGTVVTLHLASNSGYSLSYIARNNNEDYTEKLNVIPDRVVNDSASYSFTVGGNIILSAYFDSSDSTSKAILDRNNKLLKSSNWTTYALYGTASGLRSRYNSLSSANPRYVIYNNAGNCTLTVPSGTIVSTSAGSPTGSNTYTVPYDRVVTVSTSVSNFKGWKIDGKLVSTDRTYSLRMNGNVTLTIQTSNTSASVGIVSKGTANSRYYAVMNWTIPDNCKLLESGFVITKDTGTDITLTTASIDERDNTTAINGQKIYPYKYYKVTSTDMNREGSFKLMMPNTGDHKFVAYIIYLDSSNRVQKAISLNSTFTS